MPPSPTTRLRLAAAVAALALIAAACGSAATTSESAPVTATQAPLGTQAPTTAFTTFDGMTVSLAEFRGEPVVLNFWASWCPSCVAEMSAAFRPVHEDLGGTITFLGMNIQDERALALELLEETGYNARQIKPLGTTHPNPAFMSNRLTTYLATDLEMVEPDREVFGIDDERIIVEPTALDEIPGLIREGAITHALVIAAFHLLEVEGLA